MVLNKLCVICGRIMTSLRRHLLELLSAKYTRTDAGVAEMLSLCPGDKCKDVNATLDMDRRYCLRNEGHHRP